MGQLASEGGTTVARAYRRDLGAAWWVSMVLVTVALGIVGRGSGGFLSVFLWSIVGFVLGSLVALSLVGWLVPARSEEEAFEEPGHAFGDAGRNAREGAGEDAGEEGRR